MIKSYLRLLQHREKASKMVKFEENYALFLGGEEYFFFYSLLLGNVLRQLDTKFGRPIMTRTRSNRVTTALEFNLTIFRPITAFFLGCEVQHTMNL